jgi:hypothetical protein
VLLNLKAFTVIEEVISFCILEGCAAAAGAFIPAFCYLRKTLSK